MNPRHLLLILLGLWLGAAPARATTLQMKEPAARAGEKGVASAFGEALWRALARQPGIKVVDRDADFVVAPSVGPLSYSAEAGLAEQSLEMWLLTPGGERALHVTVWGTSGQKPGYKGGMEPLLKEAAEEGAGRMAQAVADVLGRQGQVLSATEPGRITFERKNESLTDNDVVSVLRRGELLATAVISRVGDNMYMAQLEDGARQLRVGDSVMAREVVLHPVRWAQVAGVKKKKNKFLGVLLGAIGIGLVVGLASQNNNDSKGADPGPNAPASVTVATDAVSVARFGQGAAGQKTTATLTATALNASNIAVTAPIGWEAATGMIVPSADGKTAVYTPPNTSQIVTVAALSGLARREIKIHVGGDPARFKAKNDSPSLAAPVGVDTALTLLAYDANTLDAGGNVLVPTGSTLTAILQTQAGQNAASLLIPVDASGNQGAAANPATLVSDKNGEFRLFVRRAAAEANTQLKLVLRNQNGNDLTLLGGGDFAVTP